MSEAIQRAMCRKYGAAYLASPRDMKIGISGNVGTGLWPINGLRHTPEGCTTGWYVWVGQELSTACDLFSPLHVSHLRARCPEVEKYLGLGPGWRFIFDETYEDGWFDELLLSVS